MDSSTAVKTKRAWIYAKKPAGRWYTRRQWVGYGLLLAFLIMPFIKIGGNPMLMLHVIERKFSVFGVLFYPQDLYLFVFGMMIMLVGIVLVTALLGRVWCGWACPQTIFMELIFRRIEYWIEGDWIQQRKVNEGPDTDARAWRKLLKHSLFVLISFIIANLFLAYIIGLDALMQIITEPVDQHLVGFLSIVTFTGVFYFVFAYFRELVCTTICPYGRLQAALLDESTLAVAYDYRRGEPRGKHRKAGMSAITSGDCVDCKLCVHVCPTGIDIRNGNQLECINCTACIDACDGVMDKLNKPKGLVGFYSELELSSTAERSDLSVSAVTAPRATVFRAHKRRIWGYAGLVLLLVIVLGILVNKRTVIDGRLLRAAGSSYQLREDGTVSNLYTLELTNKSGKEIPFSLHAENTGFRLQAVNEIHALEPDGGAIMSFFLVVDQKDIKDYKTAVKVQISSQGKRIKSLSTTFMAPAAGKTRINK